MDVIPAFLFNTALVVSFTFCDGLDFNTPDPVDDICTLKPDPGPCEAAITRWFFNPATNNCETFTYGGCRGNENNFETLATCLQQCTDVCSSEVDPGPCRGAFPRWFYNRRSKTCEQFTYGGCKGNGNNFLSQEDCVDECKLDVCTLKADIGPCDGHFRRYFYNAETKRCEKFIFGGCKGNKNNFNSIEECKKQCEGICPPGVPVVSCLVDPCQFAQCPAYPQAWCRSNYCGGCKAEFFIQGIDVTKLCDCPNEDPPVNCLINPCDAQNCPAHPDAECRSNYCGGCKAEFFIQGIDVTKLCACPYEDPPVNCLINPCDAQNCQAHPEADCSANFCGGCNAHFFVSGKNVTDDCESHTGFCPPGSDVIGPCVDFCSSDKDCKLNEKCCVIGCGRSCQVAVPCPDGKPLALCQVNPCTVSSCPSIPTATCRPDYCGGCFARYFLNGKDVTQNCH